MAPKAPPKPTVPAAIRSAEEAKPGEGGEFSYDTHDTRPVVRRNQKLMEFSGACYFRFGMFRKFFPVQPSSS